ncbi:MAG: hypothetical protein K8S16_17745 [Bacteroidales bacterium]|nr:hypothetical protein [Bacteroidales bacterium]
MNLQYISDRNGNTISVVIPIRDWEALKQKYTAIMDTLDYTEPSKEEIKENILQGLKELRLIEQGKLKTRPAKEFLNEL